MAAPVPLTTPVTALRVTEGGVIRSIALDGSARVDPGASFELEVGVHLADGRLALHDALDAMVASEGTIELAADTSRYHLTPAEQLRPGSTYTLHLDGVASREAHDAQGRPREPLSGGTVDHR